MTQLLQQAMTQVQKLSPAEQDAIAALAELFEQCLRDLPYMAEQWDTDSHVDQLIALTAGCI